MSALFAAACVLALAASADEPSRPEVDDTVLVAYGFDDDVPTGPHTVRVFQDARGHVRLVDTYRHSGWGSVELRDVPGDRDFPELQGFFPETRDGHLVLQLALLVPDPSQELNIALAGPRGFRLGRDGIAFWLATRDGWLTHTSDSIPKRLFEVEPFAWYGVAVDYRVDAGRYDLWVWREGEDEPFVERLDQPNAASVVGSAVHLFSFIGDNGDDLSSVVYYVDDVLVARSRPADLPPFVAPGRRRFFVDLLAEGPRDVLRRCPPPYALDELGVDAGVLDDAEAEALETLLAGRFPAGGLAPGLEPVEAWRQGCAALEAGRSARAEAAFARGLERAPGAVALALGRALALTAQQRWDELDALLDQLLGLGDDPRLARLSALALARTGDPEAALAWLERPAAEALAAGRATAEADAWYVLLRVTGRLDEAGSYATALAGAQTAGTAEASRWHQRAGEAAFLRRDLATARHAFEAARRGADGPGPWLSLADVAWLENDYETERRLREAVYGRLSFDDAD